MRTTFCVIVAAALSLVTDQAAAQQWAAPKASAIPEADGYVEIANVAVPPEKGRVYRAVFDATHGADKPDQLIPALNMAGSELNAPAAVGAPLTKAKFGVGNPNLKVLSEMRKAGVELYVCGQNLCL